MDFSSIQKALHRSAPLGLRPLPQAVEHDEAETVAYFNLLHVCAGRCTWTLSGAGWEAEHHPTDALNPRMEKAVLWHRFTFDNDECTCIRQSPAGVEMAETWKRLGGKGVSRFADTWESDDPESGRWLYLMAGTH